MVLTSRIGALYAASVFSALVVVWADLIPRWGSWYSTHLTFRWQTNQLLEQSLRLSTDPAHLKWDMAWGNQEVHQVWGLGVPIWRLPFEAIAKLAGKPAFPDILAFAIALAGVVYLIARFHQRFYAYLSPQLNANSAWLGLFSVVFFPPFIVLCSSRFIVYEEVAAYGYLAGLLLFFWTLFVTLRPTPRSFLGLAFCSGAVAFFRPTLGVYGTASLVIAAFCVLIQYGRLRLVFAAITLYGAAICLLLLSNAKRFDAPFEFGHSLNINSLPAMAFAARFSDPYSQETIASAGPELFGALFLSRLASELPAYDDSIFPGQSPTFRWRELYFSTYNLGTLAIISITWMWLAWRGWRRFRCGENKWLLTPLELATLWSIIAALPLLFFYLRFPFISSRYLMDFAPSFAVASWVFFWLVLNSAFRIARWIRRPVLLAFLALLVWLVHGFVAAKNHITPPEARRTYTWEEVDAQMRLDDGLPPGRPPRYGYTDSLSPRQTEIPFNGTGWEASTGYTMACVSLFIEDPDTLTVDVGPTEGAKLAAADYECIQVKIGVEFLKRKQVSALPDGMRIVFHGPEMKQYRAGIQLASLGMMPAEALHDGYSKFRLLKVQWHNDASPEYLNSSSATKDPKPALPLGSWQD